MKQNLANPFLIDKYFDDVRSKKMPAQDAVNLMNVLLDNKVEMFRMIKNAGSIKDIMSIGFSLFFLR